MENVLLGSGTSVGSNTVISDSVIGRNCHIGRTITFISSSLCLGNNTVISDSVIGRNCHIGTTSFLSLCGQQQCDIRLCYRPKLSHR